MIFLNEKNNSKWLRSISIELTYCEINTLINSGFVVHPNASRIKTCLVATFSFVNLFHKNSQSSSEPSLIAAQ